MCLEPWISGATAFSVTSSVGLTQTCESLAVTNPRSPSPPCTQNLLFFGPGPAAAQESGCWGEQASVREAVHWAVGWWAW